MIFMTSYKFNSIHSLLSIREQLYILTSPTEMTDWLRSFHRIFFIYIKVIFLFVYPFIFFAIQAFPYFVHLSSAYAYQIYISSVFVVDHTSFRTIFWAEKTRRKK